MATILNMKHQIYEEEISGVRQNTFCLHVIFIINFIRVLYKLKEIGLAPVKGRDSL